MEKGEDQKVNINEADESQLITLPGVGKSMAVRIIAGRPYRSLDQLVEVKGLGSRTLESMRPRITLGNAVGRSVQDPAGRSKPGTSGEPSVMDRLEGWAQSSMERFQIPSQVVWFVLATGVISVFLSVVLSLTILAGINRTLNFGRHAAVREVRADISMMETSLNGLASNLASLDQRLQAVEGLSGRMATLEADFEVIQENVDHAVAVVDQLTGEVGRVAAEVDNMAEKVGLFDSFMDGLRILIADLFPPDKTTPSP